MEKEEIIKKIEELFIKKYEDTMFSAINVWACKDCEDELTKYCKEHIEEFKEFAKNTLSNPDECCYKVSELCDVVLPEISDKIRHITNDNRTFTEKMFDLIKSSSNIIANSIGYSERHIFENCNIWLNYFNNTENVDYYKDYVEYKEYLKKHYIGWNPFREDDPNPTYEEFLANKEKYQI